MGKVMFVVSEEEVLKALADEKKEVLDPHRMFGPWFNSEEEYDEWAGSGGTGLMNLYLMFLRSSEFWFVN